MSQYRLSIPRRCPQCGTLSTIELQQTLKGPAVLLSWVCSECEKGWPVSREEPKLVQQRADESDQRGTAAQNRRE
jgi:hypothetical protein